VFRGAISESGVIVGLAPSTITPESWQPFYDKITAAAGCSNAADTLACLRTVPVDVLSDIFNSSVTDNAPFSVVIDNDFFIDTGTNLTVNGQFVKVPYLLGTNHDEGTAFGAKGINTTEEFLNVVTSGGVDDATAAVIAVVYPNIPEIGIPNTFIGTPPASQEFGLQFKRAAAYAGDHIMQAPRRLTSQSWAKYNTTAYTYVFDILPNGVNADIGATHFQEVSFVFHNIAGNGYNNVVAVPPFEGKPESYVQAATLISRSWINFIVNGDPNFLGSELNSFHFRGPILTNLANDLFLNPANCFILTW
jgi:carboxylesterase type B